MTKIAGSGSISQRHGSADPYLDPPQNVMDGGVNGYFTALDGLVGLGEQCGKVTLTHCSPPPTLMRLSYFLDNRLLTRFYKQETKILLRKDDANIKK
jgi:hypothetical protein